MSNLNEDQFAQYSARVVPHPVHEYEFEPLPASMERHAPGEYQPTLPGMESMLKGETTHTSVFFPKPKPKMDEWADIEGSNWRPNHGQRHTDTVNPRDLHPVQDWVEDNSLHGGRPEDSEPSSHPREWRHRPLVEKIGNQRIIQDGHHRAARAILRGANQIQVNRWDA